MVRRFEDVLERVESFNPSADFDLLRRAYIFSAREHRNQVRRSGEPYLIHPIEVAYVLADLELDTASVVAGLLHDVVEDTLTTIETVRDYFGEDVAHIVAGVTKISKLQFASKEQAEAENLRKMILAMVDDIRVILVKLADRLHNMRTLEHLAPDKQERIARETAEIYAPLANRLGMGRIKSELEDLTLKYLEPQANVALVSALEAKRKISEAFIEEIRRKLVTALEDAGIAAQISGRIKSVSSIYRKIRRQKIEVEEVYDYVAFRILTESIKDCYGALGIVHSIWRPVPGRIKDFIAIPKPNMYQSLHTSVMTEVGQPFEVQIRTREMHRIAEEGVAAHWQYKEGGKARGGEAERVAWLRHILEWQQETKDPREFLEMVKVDLYPEEVYAFTPKGKVLSFPRGSTPIDFAYGIHTDVGHRLSGAKINGRLVPLRTPLGNGDIVEILTQPHAHPSRDWLALAKTSRARGKIRSWLNANEREKSMALGRELVEKELRKYRLSPREFLENGKAGEALKKLGFAAIEDFLAAVGYGKVVPHSLVAAIVPEDELKPRTDGVVARVVKKAFGLGERRVKVKGMNDMMIMLARCCNPVRGEEIVGYITRGKGVSVHSVQCPNVRSLMFDPERRIDVEWDASGASGTLFDVKLALDVQDRQGLLAKIVSAVADEQANIRNVDAKTFEGSDARVTIVMAVSDRQQMEKVIAKVRKIAGVRDVERMLR
ncbi:MAG TPA: bifunctional (p)ppGpp synthetase/guanosine-3',5'-bis(diphosphate) 3'-pyrophosphohydrolase [Candidatus Polarisedimenticolaceae bacterium]|nr:bifunctional (p)ppGpp synthetase/guanosine-3',5'-bis(diphosphate) 3'-pyrophosphohydrolase [Candidatus Polarisedimenticolaceae bacterium]